MGNGIILVLFYISLPKFCHVFLCLIKVLHFLSLKCPNSPVCVYRNSVILCKLGDKVSTLSLPAASLTPSFVWDDFALQIRHSRSQINIIYFIRYSPKYRQSTQSQENGLDFWVQRKEGVKLSSHVNNGLFLYSKSTVWRGITYYVCCSSPCLLLSSENSSQTPLPGKSVSNSLTVISQYILCGVSSLWFSTI